MSFADEVAHSGAPDWSSPPKQNTDGYKPQSFVSTRLLHAVSLRAPSIVRHLNSPVHLTLPALPRHMLRSSHDMPRPPFVVQSASILQHSEPLSQHTPSQ